MPPPDNYLSALVLFIQGLLGCRYIFILGKNDAVKSPSKLKSLLFLTVIVASLGSIFAIQRSASAIITLEYLLMGSALLSGLIGLDLLKLVLGRYNQSQNNRNSNETKNENNIWVVQLYSIALIFLFIVFIATFTFGKLMHKAGTLVNQS